jgi:hypothetical protein
MRHLGERLSAVTRLLDCAHWIVGLDAPAHCWFWGPDADCSLRLAPEFVDEHPGPLLG